MKASIPWSMRITPYVQQWKEKERRENHWRKKHVFLRLDAASKTTLLRNIFCSFSSRQENNIFRLHCIFFFFNFFFYKNGDSKHFFLFVVFFVLAIFFATQRLLLSHIQSFLQKATLTFFHCCKRTFFLESHFWQKLFCNAMILQKLFFKAKNEKQL